MKGCFGDCCAGSAKDGAGEGTDSRMRKRARRRPAVKAAKPLSPPSRGERGDTIGNHGRGRQGRLDPPFGSLPTPAPKGKPWP